MLTIDKVRSLWAGILLVAVIAAVANQASLLSFSKSLGFSAITCAILVGLLVGNTLYGQIAPKMSAGVNFAKGNLLRAGIILYGFQITFQQIDEVGVQAVLIDALMLTSTFFITLWFGSKWLKIDKQTVYLTAAGCSICGAAAIMAAEPIIKAQSHKVAVAVAIVVLFGSLAMFFYPFIYQWLNTLFTPEEFGVYIGSSVHEVAQVVVAGKEISKDAADNAVITKMIRVMMLAPFLLLLSSSIQHNHEKTKHKIHIPWFAVWFIVVAIIHSIAFIPEWLVSYLVKIDIILLVMAMAALGLTTHIGSIRQAGLKPLLLGLLVFIWLVIGGGGINLAINYIML